jgi:organic radical activating enzyme
MIKLQRYAVTEIFHTIQGEGHHAGTAAVFIRFAGCNMWGGHVENNGRRAAAEAQEAHCPLWCDTDFRVREVLTSAEILTRVGKLPGAQMVVLTGGEPLLQLTYELIEELYRLFGMVAVETNGTLTPPANSRSLLWLTMSPKVAPAKIKLRNPNEIKVVFPDYNPLDYLPFAGKQTRLFVQPRATCETQTVGRSLLAPDVIGAAANFVLTHPEWRLSLQTHKLVGLP